MLRHYLIWTWRTLAADRVTTLLNLLALSLGLVSFALAAATALFLRSNDVGLPNSDRLYAVTEHIINADGSASNGPMPLTSAPVAKYMRAEYPEIEAITLLDGSAPLRIVSGGKIRLLTPVFTDESFLKVLKVPLRFGDPEQAFSQPRSAVLTPETATRLFGDGNPVGQILRVGEIDVTVTGVLEQMPLPTIFRNWSAFSLDLLISHDVRDQIAPPDTGPEAWDGYSGNTILLLPPGQSPEELVAKMADFGPRHVQRLQRTYKFGLVPLADLPETLLDSFLRADLTGLPVWRVLFGLGGLMLFVASLNYANLAAAKAVGRLPESGMKKVLGASRLDLLAQYLTESLTLTVAALIVVLLVLAVIAGPFAQATSIDLNRLLFHRPLFWISLVAGVVVATLIGGLYPAWLLSGPKAMSAALGGKARPVRSRLASVLVGVQFLTVGFLLIMVGVIVLQNAALRRQASQADGSRLLVIDTPLDGLGVGVSDIRNALHDIPGVQVVAGVNMVPWSLGSMERGYYRDAGVKGQRVAGFDFEINQDYFAALGMRLVAGRDFSLDRGGDVKPEADVPEVAYNVIVDRSFVQTFGWTPDQAVGQSVWHKTMTGGSAPIQIIGVVEDRPQGLMLLGSSGALYTLMPAHAQVPLIRLASDSAGDALTAIDHALTQLVPQAEWSLRYSDDLFRETSAILTTVIAALSGLALFAVIIALLGLAGMAIHTLNSRTEEIGIRKILGADHVVILRLLLWDLSKPVLIAAIAAWPLGYIAGKTYLSLFTGRVTLGLWPFVISLAVTMGVAWLAVGWRIAAASAKSPAEVLRYE